MTDMVVSGAAGQALPLPGRLWPALKIYLRPYWGKLAVVQLCAFVWAIDGMVMPIIIGNITEHIATGTDRAAQLQAALPWMIGYILMWPAMECGYRMAGFLAANVNPQVRAAIQTDLFRRLHKQDYGFLIDHQSGSLLSKIRDVSDGVLRLIDEFTWQVNNALLLIVGSMLVLVVVQPVFAAVTLALAAVYGGIGLYFGQRIAAQGARMADARSTLTGHIVDSIGNFLAVRSFAIRKSEFAAYDRLQEDERVQIRTSVRQIERIRLLYGIAGFILIAVMIMGGSFYGWSQGWITVGDIVLLNGLTFVVMQRLWFLCNELPGILQSIGAAQKALELLSRAPTVVDAADATQLHAKAGGIEFNNVTFGYLVDNPLFKNLSVSIPAGQKVGLVGYSGGGKTSFVRLIMRFFDVRHGQILIDGQDIASVTQDSLRQSINFIPQDPELFHRTIRENIAVGKPDATDAEVIEAARRAHADGFIAALPQGLASIVGERGVKLSGGQRQRIAIARVAIRSAPILILDEATSALDSVTEVAVQESLQDLMEGRTTIVIAHRLSTLLHMDRILVFDKGKLVEDGTVQQLIAGGGVFKTLWDAQVGGFLQDKPAEV